MVTRGLDEREAAETQCRPSPLLTPGSRHTPQLRPGVQGCRPEEAEPGGRAGLAAGGCIPVETRAFRVYTEFPGSSQSTFLGSSQPGCEVGRPALTIQFIRSKSNGGSEKQNDLPKSPGSQWRGCAGSPGRPVPHPVAFRTPGCLFWVGMLEKEMKTHPPQMHSVPFTDHVAVPEQQQTPERPRTKQNPLM